MSEPLCRHETITTWGTSANRLWACTSCSRRFYPACETCVDVGHRNETHPLAAPAEGLDHCEKCGATIYLPLRGDHDYGITTRHACQPAAQSDPVEKPTGFAAPAEGLDVERLREAAQPILDRALDVFDPDDLDPESSLAMPVTLRARWVYALRAALEADRCGWNTRRGDGPLGGPCALPPLHDGPHAPHAPDQTSVAQARPAAPAEGLREAVTVMDRHYGSELVARYPFGWNRVRAAIAAPAEGLREDVLAHFIDGWLAEESPEVWSWTTEKIGRRLARDWVALAATPPGDAQPEAGR